VTIGTIFEDSKIPLNKWLLAIHLLSASKKGMSSHQLHRFMARAKDKPLKIDIPEDAALRAFLKTPPPERKKPKKRAAKKKRRQT
jgi:hypothetical protein